MKKVLFKIVVLMIMTLTTLAMSGKPRCSMCSKDLPPRTMGRVELADGRVYSMCCPHCTFNMAMRIKQKGRSISAIFVKDFGSGAEISAQSTCYVFNSRLVPCCVPSIISFSDKTKAQSFQQDYGGHVLDYESIRIKFEQPDPE